MIDLYTSNTANGQKVHIVLEECALEYKLHDVDMMAGEHRSAAFLAMNPAGKIPVIVDHDGPDGKTVSLAQSMAICVYLCEKTGKLLPAHIVERAEMFRYLALVSADVSAAFSGLWWFKFGEKPPVDAAIAYYERQAHRNLKALDLRLGESPYLAGPAYTVADAVAYPVAATSVINLPGGLDGYANLARWRDEVGARPAVQRGMAAGAR